MISPVLPIARPCSRQLPGALIGLALALALAAVSARGDEGVDHLERREQLLQAIAETESRLGYRDSSLTENLAALADSALALDLYIEAAAALGRAIEIERFNSGLHTKRQLPLYLRKMEVDVRAGQWREINESLHYVHWLLMEKQISQGEELVDSLLKLSEIHLHGVAGDIESRQAGHYREAAALVYQALEISRLVWGERDPRRIDLYYGLIKHFHLQSMAIERRDETAYELRAVAPGSTWVRPRRAAQAGNYLAGLRLYDEIRRIIAGNGKDQAEALAMLDVYLADWRLLFDDGRAERDYRQAWDALRAAGAGEDTLARFFSRPRLLPAPRIRLSLDEALAAAEDSAPVNSRAPWRIREWFGNMTLPAFPETAPSLGRLRTARREDAGLRFRLDSLNEVSRWIGGTYRTLVGVIDDYEFLNPEAIAGLDAERLERQLHFLRFRPKLEEGVARPAEGILIFSYDAAPEPAAR